VKPESVEEEEMTRVPRIWGYASGGVIGLSGILAIFWWMRAVVLFGLLFWGMFSVGFLIQVGGGIKVGQSTPVISKRKIKIKAMLRGTWIGLAFGMGISAVFLIIVIIILFGFS